MAKINEILVNGILTQVTEFDHTAQAIDDAVSIVGTSPAETRLNIGAASNPNLLDNWYFADPIDQRGGYVVPPNTPYWSAMVDGTSPGNTDAYYKVTVNATRSDWYEFTMNGTVYYVPDFHVVRGYVGATQYTIDRWKVDSTGVLTVNDGNLSVGVVNDNTEAGFFQNVANPETFENVTLTMSALVKTEGAANVKVGIRGSVDGATLRSNYGVNHASTDGFTLVSYTLTLVGGSAQTLLRGVVRLVNANTTDKVYIKAAKLELGSTQTLAHQDSEGNWVLNDPPPDKGMELLKCIQSKADSSDTYANKTIATGHTCNKNLLHNWYFGNPIDQRGGYVAPAGIDYYDAPNSNRNWIGTLTEYKKATRVNDYWYSVDVGGTTYYVATSLVVRGYTGYGYGVDRWHQGTNVTTVIHDGYIHIEHTSQFNDGLIQRFEPGFFQRVTGQYMTASALLADGTLRTGTQKIVDGYTQFIWPDKAYNKVGFQLGNLNGSQFDQFSLQTTIGQTADVVAAKLELGTEQTLVHQDEDGNWVLNEIPNYAEELAKCQRYQVGVTYTNYRATYVSANTLEFTIPTPVTLRIAPTISKCEVRVVNTGTAPTGFTFVAYQQMNGIKVVATKANHGMTDGYLAFLEFSFLDANL